MKQGDKNKHTTLEARRKLTDAIVANLAPWDLKVYKLTGRLPKPRLGAAERIPKGTGANRITKEGGTLSSRDKPNRIHRRAIKHGAIMHTLFVAMASL